MRKKKHSEIGCLNKTEELDDVRGETTYTQTNKQHKENKTNKDIYFFS